MEKKQVWSTSDIIANRNNWSLAADVELLKHLQALSEKIFTKASSTLHSLNSFENDVNQTCIAIANASNKFKSLSDTQFIESKVQEESVDINEPSCSQTEPPADRENENITVKLKEALENGFRVLDTQYDFIPVSGSDSEDDGPQEILLRARNPYLSRRLPHIIGSEEFTRNDNLGLIDSSSSEEEEEEEEEEEDDDDDDDTDDNEKDIKKVRVDSDEESITVPKPPPLQTEFMRPRTEIIRISSSDSEDSEESIPCNRKQREVIAENKNKIGEKSKNDEPEKNPNSFVEHLNAALKNNPRNIYSTVPPDFEESFSPPPFPGKDNSNSSDGDSDDSSDIFATKKNTKQTASNINYKPNYESESDDDDDWSTNKIGVISKEADVLGKSFESSRKSSIVSKTSQYSNSSNSSSMANEVPKKDLSASSDRCDSQPLPKSKINESNINSINRKMVSAINSELSAKLNLKNSSAESKERLSSTKISSESSESRTLDVNSDKSSKSNTPAKVAKSESLYEQTSSNASKKNSQEPALFNQLDDKNSSEENSEDDLFRTVKKAKSKKENSKGLFGDDRNTDNLFSPLKSNSKATAKTNDLFSSKPNEPSKSDKIFIDSNPKPPVVDLFKKSDLFASDSDSEDDIFSIIKNKKKPDNDIFNTKTENIFQSVSNDSKRTSISSSDTPQSTSTNTSTKTSTIDDAVKSPPSVSKSQSFRTENESANNFNSESAKKNINEKHDVANVTSLPENSLFGDVKPAGDLFQSDDDDDSFEKTKDSTDNRTSVPKSEVQSSIVSFANTIKNVNTLKEKPASEISSNINRSSSSESTNETKSYSSLKKENTSQSVKKGNTSQIQSSKNSSSSEDKMEDTKKENNPTDLFSTPLKNKSEEADADESSKKDTKSNDETATTRTEDIFGERSNLFQDSKTKTEDIFGESYESRSSVFLPPKDDFSDGPSEDEEVNLSLDDDDLFNDDFEVPSFQQAIRDDDIFGERRDTNLPKDLFAESSSAVPSADLISKSENKEIDEDINQKPLVDNEVKADDVCDEPEESGLFNFGKKKLSGSDSDEFNPISKEKMNSASLTVQVDQFKDAEQTTTSTKASSSDGLISIQDQIEKFNEDLQKISVDKKPSPNLKVGKINTDMFEKNNIEKKLDEDVQDGNLLVKSTSPESVSSSRSVPGKLVMGRGLNINVNALLPGSNWSSKMKQKQETENIIPNKPEDLFEQSTDTLSNVIKERPKASSKRRPPSRQARKSRMMNTDIFGDGFGTELPQEENEPNEPLDSQKLPEKAKIEKLGKLEEDFTAKNILFDDEEKVDDLFGITKTADEFSSKVADSQKPNISLPEEDDSAVNLDINSSSNRLPGLTKNRAKPQKRSSPPKKTTSDIHPVISDKNIASSETVKPESIAKTANTSSDEGLIAENPPKPTPSSTKTLISKSIFDSVEDDDDDLFESIKSKKTVEKKSVPEIEPKIEPKPVPEPSSLLVAAKSKTVESAKINIFDDDDDDQLFPSAMKKLSGSKLTKKSSLFEDNDDDDLFGTKTSMSSSRKTSGTAVSSVKTKVQNEKPRVVKLRSETVQKDPLTGKDLGGPL